MADVEMTLGTTQAKYDRFRPALEAELVKNNIPLATGGGAAANQRENVRRWVTFKARNTTLNFEQKVAIAQIQPEENTFEEVS